MTINAPAIDPARDVRRRRPRGRACRRRRSAARCRTTCSRSSSRRRSGSRRPSRPCASSRDMIEFCTTRSAAVEHRSRSAATTSARPARPRSRSWRSRSPTASATCRPAVDARAGRRRLRAAPVVLLRRPQRLLRGDRQVPRGAAHVGAHHARAIRRQEPALLMLRSHAQTAGVSLTAQQPLNNVVRVTHPGAGRRPRRHAVAAHQLARRDATRCRPRRR